MLQRNMIPRVFPFFLYALVVPCICINHMHYSLVPNQVFYREELNEDECGIYFDSFVFVQ